MKNLNLGTISFILILFFSLIGCGQLVEQQDNTQLLAIQNSSITNNQPETYAEFELQRKQILAEYNVSEDIKNLSKDYLITNYGKLNIQRLNSLDQISSVEIEAKKEYPQFPTENYLEYLISQKPNLTSQNLQEKLDFKLQQIQMEKLCIIYTKLINKSTSTFSIQYATSTYWEVQYYMIAFFAKTPYLLLYATNIKDALSNVDNIATLYSNQYFGNEGGIDDKKDAFRHILSSILIANIFHDYVHKDPLNFNASYDVKYTTLEEMTCYELGGARTNNKPEATAMDLNNNYVGQLLYWQENMHDKTNPQRAQFIAQYINDNAVFVTDMLSDSPPQNVEEIPWFNYKNSIAYYWYQRVDDTEEHRITYNKEKVENKLKKLVNYYAKPIYFVIKDLILDPASTKSNFYQASHSITAGNGLKIKSSEIVTYSAGSEININSDFDIEPGASFDAVIE
ncbi:DUF6973 domain-containing protein [Candidatus Margulisiibacteriota bacterium]